MRIHWKEPHGPHCHVQKPGAKASFDLRTLECLASTGFSEIALNRIQKALGRYQSFLMERWHEIQDESKD
ncbi:MAG: DUF4160 domain-containing protein [Deltaproteobacteria bacterium]|nr:DUF4160 domain-containing protein [Deltaproteobacteria bacterium]